MKINELLSCQSAPPRQRQRRNTLQKMIAQWGWSPDYVAELDGRKAASIEKILTERAIIAQELIEGYQLLNRFARKHTGRQQTGNLEIKLLGRKLRASLEKKPGKVGIINLYAHGDARQPVLYLVETELADSGTGWAVHLNHNHHSRPFSKSRNLLELLGWIVLNGLYYSKTHLAVRSRNAGLTTKELRQIMRALTPYIHHAPNSDQSLDVYRTSPRIVICVLFANIGEDPLEGGRKDGMHLMSDRSDALSYGYMRRNLVRHLEKLCFTSWGEILTSRYEGSDALCNCLCDILNHSLVENVPKLACHSFSSPRATSIAFRIQEVFNAVSKIFSVQPPDQATRYILRVGHSFTIFRCQNSLLEHWTAPTFNALQNQLSTPQALFSPVVFDDYALEDSPLPALYRYNEPRIQVFYLVGPKYVEVFVIDERGSLFHQKHHHIDSQTLLAPYASLLNAIVQRYADLDNAIDYFSVRKENFGNYVVTKTPFDPLKVQEFIKLRVVGEEVNPGCTAYTLYCNEKEISSKDYGDDVFSQAADYIVNLRKSKDPYPVYITDIDVPFIALGIDSPEQLQTLHLLDLKRKCEDRLNIHHKDRALTTRNRAIIS